MKVAVRWLAEGDGRLARLRRSPGIPMVLGGHLRGRVGHLAGRELDVLEVECFLFWRLTLTGVKAFLQHPAQGRPNRESRRSFPLRSFSRSVAGGGPRK